MDLYTKLLLLFQRPKYIIIKPHVYKPHFIFGACFDTRVETKNHDIEKKYKKNQIFFI